MNSPEKIRLVEQMAAIPAMERGKLSLHSSGRHQKLQRWQAGRNHTRHVPADELPAEQSALAGYAHYQQLTAKFFLERRTEATTVRSQAAFRTVVLNISPRPSRFNAPAATPSHR